MPPTASAAPWTAPMGEHRPAPHTYPSRLWLGLMAAAVTGIAVPPTVLVARASAPQVAADSVSLPERSPEPFGRGDLGGPLVLPSIGVVVPLSASVPVSTTQGHAPTTHSRSHAASGQGIHTWTSSSSRQLSPSTPPAATTTQPGTVLPSPTDSQPASTDTSGTATDPTTQPSESLPISSSATPSEQPTSSQPSQTDTDPCAGLPILQPSCAPAVTAPTTTAPTD